MRRNKSKKTPLKQNKENKISESHCSINLNVHLLLFFSFKGNVEVSVFSISRIYELLICKLCEQWQFTNLNVL